MKSSVTEKAAPQSTISRLESKYSDILDRVAKRKAKQQQEKEKEDRDKTLEPDYRSHMPVALTKSQTTANVARSDKPVAQKERTPFRLDRNKMKYNSDLDVKIKRSELIGLSGGNSNSSNYHDSYTKMKSNDSGYYDAYRGYGKENVYKSKYDPDVLLSEMSSTNGNRRTSATQQQPYAAGSSTSRQIKPYKRTESGDKRRTAINLYELLHDEDPELDDRHQRRHQYMQRKSTGNQLRLEAHRSRDYLNSNEDLLDAEKTERENKRKEIQSLIMKYAQMDDFYGKSSMHEEEKEKERERDNNNNNSKIDPWDTKSNYSPVMISKKSSNPLGKSQTMANVTSLHDTGSYSSWYNSNYNSNGIVPIKTNVTPSASKSRMSKALSTFVRVFTLQTRFSYLLLAFLISGRFIKRKTRQRTTLFSSIT